MSDDPFAYGRDTNLPPGVLLSDIGLAGIDDGFSPDRDEDDNDTDENEFNEDEE